MQLVAELNKYGICLQPTKKYAILEDIGTDFVDQAVELVKSGFKFVVPNLNLPDSGPQRDLRKCSIHDVVAVNEEDLEAMRCRYRVIIAKLLFEHLKAFKMFAPYVPQTTECVYTEEMTAKSDVLTFWIS